MKHLFSGSATRIHGSHGEEQGFRFSQILHFVFSIQRNAITVCHPSQVVSPGELPALKPAEDTLEIMCEGFQRTG
jgi:hypothetical protein